MTGGDPYTIYLGLTQYGDGRRVQRGDFIDEENAKRETQQLLENKFLPLLSQIPYWDEMPAHKQGALLSYAWNLGEGFYQARGGFNTIQKALRDKDWDSIPKIMRLYYNPSDARVRLGLYRRRWAEGWVWNGMDVDAACRKTQDIVITPAGK